MNCRHTMEPWCWSGKKNRFAALPERYSLPGVQAEISAQLRPSIRRNGVVMAVGVDEKKWKISHQFEREDAIFAAQKHA
jgi:hypothetical protein